MTADPDCPRCSFPLSRHPHRYQVWENGERVWKFCAAPPSEES